MQEGRKSRVSVSGSSTTSGGSPRPYWDEEGVYHIHENNATTTSFFCTNGHAWNAKSFPPCPGCGVMRGPTEIVWMIGAKEVANDAGGTD
jgi:hypothetical protein